MFSLCLRQLFEGWSLCSIPNYLSSNQNIMPLIYKPVFHLFTWSFCLELSFLKLNSTSKQCQILPEFFPNKMDKFCGCVRLQLGVFFSVGLSLLAWLTLLAIYIPYILFYSPMEIHGEFKTEDEALEIAVPGQDYGTGSVAPIIILMGVFVDTLLLSGTYKKYHVKSDLVKKNLENNWKLDFKTCV